MLSYSFVLQCFLDFVKALCRRVFFFPFHSLTHTLNAREEEEGQEPPGGRIIVMCTKDVRGEIFIHSQPETELENNLVNPNCVKIGLKQGFVYLGRSEFRLSSTFGSRILELVLFCSFKLTSIYEGDGPIKTISLISWCDRSFWSRFNTYPTPYPSYHIRVKQYLYQMLYSFGSSFNRCLV